MRQRRETVDVDSFSDLVFSKRLERYVPLDVVFPLCPNRESPRGRYLPCHLSARAVAMLLLCAPACRLGFASCQRTSWSAYPCRPNPCHPAPHMQVPPNMRHKRGQSSGSTPSTSARIPVKIVATGAPSSLTPKVTVQDARVPAIRYLALLINLMKDVIVDSIMVPYLRSWIRCRLSAHYSYAVHGAPYSYVLAEKKKHQRACIY